MRKVVLHGQRLHQARLHSGREQLVVVASSLLRPVHRGIGVAHQPIRIAGVLWEYADADARSDMELMASDRARLPDSPQNSLRNDGRICSALDSRQYERELIPANPRHGIPFADRLRELAGHLLKQLIAGGMANGVIYRLEAVEVQEHDRNLLTAPSRLRQINAEPLLKLRAVR